MYERLLFNKSEIAVVGLGYVGLPIALEFAKDFDVVGFDINESRVEMMEDGVDPSNELDGSEFENKHITFTADVSNMSQAKFFVVAVPTPIDQTNEPDLRPLIGATRSVAKVLKKGDYVVFESTVYPGCTEEVCVPILEEETGLKLNEDFKIGYSPERINPGDKVNTLTKITKVVSGSDKESLEQIAKIYGHIIDAGVHRASSIKVAEASKVIENTQRDVNIALINELSVIFNKLGIDTYEVLESAGTKWNFLNFQPGLVGGHCIGVDPYYLIHKAKAVGVHPNVIASSRARNDEMASNLAYSLLQKLKEKGKDANECRVLVQGITFKEDVSDIRNSKVVDLIKELDFKGFQVDVTDPYADHEEVMEEYGIEMKSKPEGQYDAVVVAVNHKQYAFLDEAFYHTVCTSDPIILDLKKTVQGKVNGYDYMSM
ncbi:MAG: nucleotide sugar dehydrogenase [Bacteroidota bacterium]